MNRGIYEMQKIHTIIELILLLLLICVSTGYCIQSYRLEIVRSKFEYYRAEFENAQSRQQEAFDTIDECYRNVERAGEILNQSVNTISDVRKQISEIRENYDAMENRMCQFYDNNNRINNSNVSNQVGE